MSFLLPLPLPLPRLSSVNALQRRLLNSPHPRKGGNGTLMLQLNVHPLMSNSQQLPRLYPGRKPQPC